MTAEEAWPWPDGDPRWDDDAATVPFGPGTPPPPQRPALRPRRWPRLAAVLAGLSILVGGAATASRLGVLPSPTPVVAAAFGCEPGRQLGASGTVQQIAVDRGCRTARYDRATAVLQIASRRYRVGEPGDWMLVGDWDCDGEATAALYRPADGTVRTFSSWPGASALASDAPIESGVIDGVPRTVRSGRCDRVEVEPARGAGGGPSRMHPTP